MPKPSQSKVISCKAGFVLLQGIRNVPTRLRIQIQRRRNDDEDAKVSYLWGNACRLALCVFIKSIMLNCRLCCMHAIPACFLPLSRLCWCCKPALAAQKHLILRWHRLYCSYTLHGLAAEALADHCPTAGGVLLLCDNSRQPGD